MDTKYFINIEEGKINYVGVYTEEGKIFIEKITDTKNISVYKQNLLSINKKYGGDFFSKVEKGEVKTIKKSFFEKFLEPEKTKQIKEKKQSSKDLTKRVNAKDRAKKAVAIALIAAVATTSVACLNKKAKDDKQKAVLENTNTPTVEMIDESLESATISVENKTVDELINMLDDSERKEAFNKIVSVQDYFNEKAAPTVKQGDKQLFFTFDETTSAYLYANAKALSSSKMASFFGQSNIIVLNEETGEYEQIDKDLAAAKYLSFCQNLSYYYQLGATEKSGVDGLFENEKEAELFKNFEEKILEYNRTKSETSKAEIVKMLENIYMSGEVDATKDKYQGATSIIGTAIVPYLYLNNVIDKDMYNSIVEINETVTCQDIYSQIEKITLKMSKENGKEEVIEQIAKLQNEKYKDLDRNVSMEESLEGYRLSDLDNAIVNTTPSFAENETVTEYYQTTTTSRNEAVNQTSEEQVKQAENEADKDAGITQKNEDENAYWDGYMAGYNKAYDNVWNGGSGNISIPSGSAKYVQGFKDGVSAGINAAKEDLAQAENDKENYQPTPQEDEVVEETFVYEEPVETPEDEIIEETFVYEEPAPVETPENEIIEETFVYEEPAPVETPENEIIEETFIYEDSADTEVERQKVQFVESHDSEYIYEVTPESESVAKIRVISND